MDGYRDGTLTFNSPRWTFVVMVILVWSIVLVLFICLSCLENSHQLRILTGRVKGEYALHVC